MKTHITSQMPHALCILFLIIICYSTACKKDIYNLHNNQPFISGQAMGDIGASTTDTTLVDGPPPEDELVAWRKHGRTQAEYKAWFDSVKRVFGDTMTENDPCQSCDNTLVVLKGKSIKNYIQTGGTVSGNTT